MSKFPIFTSTLTSDFNIISLKEAYRVIMKNKDEFEQVYWTNEYDEIYVIVQMSCPKMDTLYSELRILFKEDGDMKLLEDILVDGSLLFTEGDEEGKFGENALCDEFDQSFFGYSPEEDCK